jgi:HK97 family phage prohead protease
MTLHQKAYTPFERLIGRPRADSLMTRSAPRSSAKRNGPPASNQSRAASAVAGSYSAETRTFRVILSTGAPVKRFGFVEELSLDPAAVDLSRVPLAQVKFLDSHNQGAVGAIIGTLTEARFEGGALVGNVQLAESEAARAVEPDIASGHIKGVSIGYRVDTWTLVQTGDVETWRADKWALLEVSAVSVPADAGAMIRSLEDDDANEDGDEAAPPATRKHGKVRGLSAADYKFLAETGGESFKPTLDRMVSESAERSVVWEACRIHMAAKTEIETREFREAGGYIPSGETMTAQHFACLRGHNEPPNIKGTMMHANAQTLDNPAFLRQTLEDALYARATGKAPEGAARDFVGAPLDAYDDILAEARGERRSWLSRASGRWFGGEMTRTHSTSDFPNLLAGAGNRVLQDAYQVAQSPLILLGRERQAPDFRAINVLKISEAPSLAKVSEGGEVTYGSRGEGKEAFSVETFGRIFSMTRQAYINDDLGAFADFLQAFGRAAAETIAAQMVALLTANSGNGVNLDDGNPLFTTARGNKASSGTAIDITNLGLARKALRETKGLDGKTPINLTPRYLIVGPAKETEAEQAISNILANQVSNANPFSGKLEVLVEPRLAGNAWRVFAEPSQQAVLSYAYLNGRRGPSIETRDGWTTLGVEFRAVLDFGCGVTDWRGAYLNSGN